MSLFHQGLKENVKNKLICDGAKISNLIILIKKAIAINDKLYFRAMKKNPKKNVQGRTKYIFSPGFYERTSSYPQKNLIKLDNLQVSTAKKEKKKEETGSLYSIITYIV